MTVENYKLLCGEISFSKKRKLSSTYPTSKFFWLIFILLEFFFSKMEAGEKLGQLREIENFSL